ncbi:MAG TPA: TonB family protein [Terriglobales bacterium]|nr:TonB family protein [Terriglobales bacterium]
MVLRALLFSSDGDTTSTLCHVLTGLGIEAEICAEMLVAVQHLTQGSYDALVVDWDQQTDATFLLKTARELKTAPQILNLALVQSDADLALALQSGANSVIRKPVNQQHARDTLSTARDLILSWQAEQREKEFRLAAAQEAASQIADDLPEEQEAPAPKPGFLSQAAPRSALEAEEIAREKSAQAESSVPEEPQPEEPPPPVKSAAPVSLRAWQEMQEKKTAAAPPKPEETAAEEFVSPQPRSQDVGGIFSSFPENPETGEAASAPRKNYGIAAVAAVLLISGGFYAWAPGHPGLAHLLWSLHSIITGEAVPGSAAPRPAPPAEPAGEPAVPSVAEKSADPAVPDTASPSDADSSQIHVIETKAIPPAGAQQPPSTDTSTDPSQGQKAAEVAAPPQAQPVGETESAPAAPAPGEAPAQDSQPQVAPPPVPVPPAAAPPPPSTPAPAVETGADGRVIIPDSLKTGPLPPPVSSLEPIMVPEETSRGLLLHSVDPMYPPQAIQQKMEGPVLLQAWVGTDGSVRDLKLVRGYFALGRAAVDAVKQWRFKPYNLNGHPIDFQTYITINFKLPS